MADEYERAKELHEQGLTYAAIGRRLGINASTVYGWLRRGKRPGIPAAVAIGERFGRLVVVAEDPVRSSGRSRRYLVRCDCGGERVVESGSLRGRKTRSCGCLAQEMRRAHGASLNLTHGHSRAVGGGPSRIYSTWRAMITRCTRENHEAYQRYGGRGITICDRWLGDDGFENFLADMGERPEGKTLDRIDPDGNYEPDNCRWATPLEQRHNRSQHDRPSGCKVREDERG